MNGRQYETAIDKLGLSKDGAAAFFEVNRSTVLKWIANRHPIPASVAMLLRLMIRMGLTPDDVK